MTRNLQEKFGIFDVKQSQQDAFPMAHSAVYTHATALRMHSLLHINTYMLISRTHATNTRCPSRRRTREKRKSLVVEGKFEDTKMKLPVAYWPLTTLINFFQASVFTIRIRSFLCFTCIVRSSDEAGRRRRFCRVPVEGLC